MAGGINFRVAAPILAQIIENGIDPTDPRVRQRVDEAQKEILDSLIPVNGMMTVNVQATGTTLLLPKEMENAIEVEIQGNASQQGQTDVIQGWFEVVNNFAYVDPMSAHDNPLVDQFLQPDPVDPSILRRQYDYPGLTPNAVVQVTGAKRWLPITNDTDYLIVQNIPALKEMIQAIEYGERNDQQGAEAFRKRCIERLQAEVKKHLLDPTNSLRRKANYETDLATLRSHTFGWTRARLAFEVPGAMNMGKSELSRIIEQAEMKFFDKGQWIGTLQEYTAQVIDGLILTPKEVEAIIATEIGGHPISVNSLFFRYIEQGHRWWRFCPVCPELRDLGEIIDADGDYRRQYELVGSNIAPITGTNPPPRTLRFIAALRWVKKKPTDQMQLRNFEAMRLMVSSILKQKQENYQGQMKDESDAISEVDGELNRYLSGQKVVAPVDWNFLRGRGTHGLGWGGWL